MADVEIVGRAQFVAVARKLSAMGKEGGGLRRELNKQLNTAVEPLSQAVITHLGEYLPSGYAPVLASTLTVRAALSSGTAIGLRLTAKAKGVTRNRQIRVINNGVLRHPVYGDRDVWVNQHVKPGFWDEPLTAAKDIPKEKLQEAVRNVIRRIA